ncbi:MAG: hypothetical protein IJ747_08245 [Lachnospiraceae bacterium]|nr:hypothetical protein [Lachnospiraceae bacterium]
MTGSEDKLQDQKSNKRQAVTPARGAQWMDRLERFPLWGLGLVLLGVTFRSIARLGAGCVFTVHDQLDESMMNYVLTARHAGEQVIPEMLGGINASGLAPSAVLFVPLFWVLSPLHAFLAMYAVVFVSAFLGMYLLVRELSESNLLAAATAGCFCMLPFYPVYGLSQAGIPLVLYAFLCLYRGKKRVTAYACISFFGLTSHLVYTGYAVLGLAAVWLLAELVRSRRAAALRAAGADAVTVDAVGVHRADGNAAGADEMRDAAIAAHRRGLRGVLYGFLLLLVVYVGSNVQLFAEILFSQGGYVSHREEMVNSAMPFGETVWSVFMHSAQHAFTYQEKLVWPIVFLLAAGGMCYRLLDQTGRKRYLAAVGGFVLLFLIAVFYGICKSGPVVRWKNGMTGFLHYFQMERFYWLYPAGWYLELALAFSFWGRREEPGNQREASQPAWILRRILSSPVLRYLLLAAVLLPTADTILHNSYFYQNVNQYNNGSGVTGYISWESYYAEDLMEELEQAIGRDRTTYRVAHLGISPAPSLMHGFYTVDGYSNNYPLDYKHAFRRVIAAELDKSPQTAVYFDKWGNRCYLFNALSGTYWMLEKGSDVRYEGLAFDMDALAELGCAYLFSGGEIVDAGRMGLEPMGYYETADSYWGIWLYRLTGTDGAARPSE